MSKSMSIQVKLSILWLFATLNYLYADVFTLFFVPGAQEEALSFTGGSAIVPLAFAAVMETAIAMVLLSRLLPYAVNRWFNIVVGVLHTALVFWSAVEDTPEPFYVFFATIEIATTVFIIWTAWKWSKTSRPNNSLDKGAAPL